MTTKSTLFSLATLLISAATLISCAKDETQTVNNQNTPAQTSTAVSYASIYSDESCTTPLVENVPLTGATTDINFVLSYGLDKVYMKYPTSEGTKVIALDVPQETVTKADPGSYTYFKYESDRYVTLTVKLPEDAVKNYVTNAGGFTNYHSSGVAMFEDTWPSKSNVDNIPTGELFGDFNDFVADYDLESTINDTADPAQTWKEQLKVVMHVRAMGGGYPQRFGLLLEGFDKQYVDDSKTEVKVTLGNYNTDIADPLTASVVWQGDHPIIYINGLNKLINKTSAAKNGLTLGSVHKLYNTENDANLNVAKGLFTITVIFKGADRSQLSASEADAQAANYKSAVINTRQQNFFLITKQGNKSYEIHMQNYAPTEAYKASYSKDLNDKAEGVAVAKDPVNTYTAADGNVWGFKVPTLTRHATEHTAFTVAYPMYKEWLQNRTASAADWYIIDNANRETTGTPVTFCTGLTKDPMRYVIEEW
jgi:LruC domain-containing protein